MVVISTEIRNTGKEKVYEEEGKENKLDFGQVKIFKSNVKGVVGYMRR